MTLLPGRIAEVCVTGLSRDKFTMGNIHGYPKKKRETSHDIKRGIKLGCFDTPGQENQSGFFIGQQHEKAKKVNILRGFFRHVSERSMLTWQFLLYLKVNFKARF